MVGFILLVGRGSTAQLQSALVISVAFLVLQTKTWPYKDSADNLFRVATETHVCIAIASSCVLAKIDLRFEVLQAGFYDHVLLLSFIVLVPGAFVVAVWLKVRHMNAAVQALGEQSENRLQERRRAFDLHVVGLGSATEKKALQRYVDGCECCTKCFVVLLAKRC